MARDTAFLALTLTAILLLAPPSRADSLAERGRYLATIMDCGGCHTPGAMAGQPDKARLLGGSDLGFEIPELGVFYPPNLTPDKETGLGNYTAAQIKQALRTGKRLDGKTMAPPMSMFIPHFSGMTDEDLDAIVAYLQSLPAKKHKIPDNQLTPAAQRVVGQSGHN